MLTPVPNWWLFGWFAIGIWLWPSLSQAVTLPDNYPRVGNIYLASSITNDEARQLAQWDVVVIGLETQYTNPEAIPLLRALNPDIIILGYIPSEEVSLDNFRINDPDHPLYKIYRPLRNHDDWFLKNTSGDYLNFWPGTRMINVSTRWSTALAKSVSRHVLKKHSQWWDGVYYDNCFNDISWLDGSIDIDGSGTAASSSTADQRWRVGMGTLLKQTAKRNPTKVIVCNSSGDYYTYINGRMFEDFPSANEGQWSGSMQRYADVMQRAQQPRLVIVNTIANTTTSTNYRLMRYNLASALLHDGFASYDQSSFAHHSLWWYDEYGAALGAPLASGYNIQTNASLVKASRGVWRRNFQRGLVLVNSTDQNQRVVLEDGFEKITGTQDTVINNGKLVGSVTLPANDGIILLGRIAQVVNAPYINGTFAKVFSANGKTQRNSFFTYNGTFPGSSTVVQLDDINTSVVADDTYVTVYTNGRQTSRFAPYGEQFTGGVNIDVDRLNGKRKAYRIVTGTKTYGPHVRIFSLRGQATNPGCFPYASDFRGGVNVAVGDVDRNNRGQEIVVAAAKGGGPHIRILDRNCRLLHPGFFAYDASLHSGVVVAVGDVDNDGHDDIVTIPGAGATPYVRIFNYKGQALQPGFYAFSQSDRSGAQVAVSDIDGDGLNELIAMSFGIFNQ